VPIATIVRALLMTAALAGCTWGHYVLPGDDDGPAPSKPAFQGRITTVGDNHLVVESDVGLDAPQRIAFRLGSRTQLFTVYGGLVAVRELTVGQRVRVWFDERGLPAQPDNSIAAVVMLASMDPNRDWP
jgi:hypothetical protein